MTEFGPMTLLLAAALLVEVCLALHYITIFYPPGYGYEEEKRNGRRIAALLVSAAVTAAVLYAQAG